MSYGKNETYRFIKDNIGNKNKNIVLEELKKIIEMSNLSEYDKKRCLEKLVYLKADLEALEEYRNSSF